MARRRWLPQPLPWPPRATRRWAVPSVRYTSKSTEACPRWPGTACAGTLINGGNTVLPHDNMPKRLRSQRLESHAGCVASRGFDRLVKYTRNYRALALCLRVTTCFQPMAAALNNAVFLDKDPKPATRYICHTCTNSRRSAPPPPSLTESGTSNYTYSIMYGQNGKKP